jgi:hypothetical protein
MPAFAIPEWVEVVSELEKTSTGKGESLFARGQLPTATRRLISCLFASPSVQKNLLRDKLKALWGKK